MTEAKADQTKPAERENSGRCLFCLQEPEHMIDPRVLDCGDITCLPCAEDKILAKTFKCPACSLENEVNDLSKLPLVTNLTANLPDGKSSEEKEYCCEICDGVIIPSGYCIQCNKIMCKDHCKAHKTFFENEKHKVISVENFSQRPDYYTSPVCEVHETNIVSMVCSICFKFKCFRCPPSMCGKDESHTFVSLEQMRDQMEKRFDELIQKCAGKVDDLNVLEKKTWLAMDSLSEKCSIMATEVDKTLEKQIASLKEQAATLKQDIVEYQADRLGNVEGYLSSLVQKREDLQTIQYSTCRYIRDNHVSDIIKQRDEKSEELISASQVDTMTEFDCGELVLLADETVKQLGGKPVDVDGSYAYSLAFLDPNKVIIGTSCGYIGVCDAGELKRCSQHRLDSTIHSISVCRDAGQVVFATNKAVYQSRPDLSDIHEVFKFTYQSEPRVAANAEFIVVCNPVHRGSLHQLLVYSMKLKEIDYYYLEGVNLIRSISFHTDGDLLVLDAEHGSVIKYTIFEDRKPKKSSSLSSLPRDGKCYAMCVDNNGVIYISSYSSHLHILYSGKEVGKLNVPSLSPNSSSSAISVQDGYLISTRSGSKTVDMFELR